MLVRKAVNRCPDLVVFGEDEGVLPADAVGGAGEQGPVARPQLLRQQPLAAEDRTDEVRVEESVEE